LFEPLLAPLIASNKVVILSTVILLYRPKIPGSWIFRPAKLAVILVILSQQIRSMGGMEFLVSEPPRILCFKYMHPFHFHIVLISTLFPCLYHYIHVKS